VDNVPQSWSVLTIEREEGQVGSLTIFRGDYTLDKNWELGDGLQPFHVLRTQDPRTKGFIIHAQEERHAIQCRLCNGKETKMVPGFYLTFQLRDLSIWPATYEANPESWVCIHNSQNRKIQHSENQFKTCLSKRLNIHFPSSEKTTPHGC